MVLYCFAATGPVHLKHYGRTLIELCKRNTQMQTSVSRSNVVKRSPKFLRNNVKAEVIQKMIASSYYC